MSHLSLPQLKGLATWSFGMALTRSSSEGPGISIHCPVK